MTVEDLLPYRIEDEDWREGERIRCAGCTRHVRRATRVATSDLGEEFYLCDTCLGRAVANLTRDTMGRL